ncbi:hypothetical protein [Sphingomonas sp. M1A8_2b]
MEFEFDLPTFDADDAREIEVVKDGKSYGVFYVKHQFVGSPKWLLDYKRATAKLSNNEKKRIDELNTEDDILLRRKVLIRMFVEKYVTDSKSLPVKGGTWKHSTEALIKFFMLPQAFFVYQELDAFSADESNFQTAQVVTEKNS